MDVSRINNSDGTTNDAWFRFQIMHIRFTIIHRCVYKAIAVISRYFGCLEKKKGGGAGVSLHYKSDRKYRNSNNHVSRNSVLFNPNFTIKNYIV